jgi:hypothetical protein
VGTKVINVTGMTRLTEFTGKQFPLPKGEFLVFVDPVNPVKPGTVALL